MLEDRRIIDYVRRPGVSDIFPISARASFARALMLEDRRGHTTAAAEHELDRAIIFLDKGEYTWE